jgi:UDP:flavonoid glycosyltransferase YjiC (YdhE family)
LEAVEKAIFNESSQLKQTRMIIEKLLLPAEAAMSEAAEKLCRENDLVIGHFFLYPLQTIAQALKRPYVSIALVHSIIPSQWGPPSGLPNLGKFGNSIAWRLAKAALNKSIKPYADALRSRYDLPPSDDLLNDVWSSKQLTLIAVSPEVCQPRADWPAYYRVCGFLTTPDSYLKESINDDLEHFITQGEPPVYVTFGSAMAGNSPKETLTLLCAAAQMAEIRAIIQTSDWQKHGLESSDKIHFVQASPHNIIFPHCKAVVHHGGAGTTQSVLLAGKPSVVVSHTSEQEFWGRELTRLGFAPEAIPRRKLTVKSLAKKIIEAISSKDFTENAAKISKRMAKEDGVAMALQLIEEKFTN